LKFSVNDINERLRWKEYMSAYESIDLRVPDLSHRERRELNDAKRRLCARRDVRSGEHPGATPG
jgi:hypothetical protein